MGIGVTRNTTASYRPSNNFGPMPIHMFFERALVAYPKNYALMSAEMRKSMRTPMTYEELSRLSTKCAKVLFELMEHDQNDESVIIVCCEPTPSLIVLLLGIWKVGSAYLAIDIMDIEGVYQKVIKKIKPRCIVFEEHTAEKFDWLKNVPKVSISALMYAVNVLSKELGDLPSFRNMYRMDALCAIMFTSGSSGVPKAVNITHQALYNIISWEWREMPFVSKEKFTIFQSSISHVDSLVELWCHLLQGVTVLVLPVDVRYQAVRLVGVLNEYSIMRFHTVPNVIGSIIHYVHYKTGTPHQSTLLRSLKYWFCSGELLTSKLVQQFYECFSGLSHELYNVYSCTEAAGAVSYFRCTEHTADMFDYIPISGRTIDNVQLYIVDENLDPVPPGKMGELCVSGICISNGYVAAHSKNIRPNPFTDNPDYSRLFMTGDYGVQEDDLIIFKGRIEGDANIQGLKLNAAEVEKSIASMACVTKSVVIAYYIGREEYKLLAFAKLAQNSPIDTKQKMKQLLDEDIRDSTELIVLGDLPISTNGKVDRASLLRCYNDVDQVKRRSSSVIVDMHDIAENDKFLSNELFDEVLLVMKGIDIPLPLHIEMNFFNIGGNSLQAVEVIQALAQKGYHMTMVDFAMADNFGGIIDKMRPSPFPGLGSFQSISQFSKFEVVPLQSVNKIDGVRFVRRVVFKKGMEIDHYLEPNQFLTEFANHLINIWLDLIGLSFFVKEKDSPTFVGFSLNIQGTFFPDVPMTPSISTLYQFYEFLLSALRMQYFVKVHKPIMLDILTGTSPNLKSSDNLALLQFIENEKLTICANRNFSNILVLNTNLLMQKISSDIFLYKTLLRFQLNAYETEDKVKPFNEAPDDLEVMVQWKILE